MHSERRIELMQLTLAKMALLLREAFGARQESEHDLDVMRQDCERLQSDLLILRAELQEQRDRNLASIRLGHHREHQLSSELANAHESIERLEMQLREQHKQSRIWEERYALVDNERRELEASLTQYANNELANVNLHAGNDHQIIGDIQECPNCCGEQLQHVQDAIYKCPFCDQAFRLNFEN